MKMLVKCAFMILAEYVEASTEPRVVDGFQNIVDLVEGIERPCAVRTTENAGDVLSEEYN